MLLAIIAAAAAMQGNPPVGDIQKILNKPPAFTLQTTKRPIDMELCVGDAMSDMTSPTVLHDGADRVVIVGFTGSFGNPEPIHAVDLRASPDGTTVNGHVSKLFNDRLRAALQRCL